MKRSDLIIAIPALLYLIILICGVIVFSTSCSKQPKQTVYSRYTWRAQVVENGTITHVDMVGTERFTYLMGDSVWVNMDTHRVDDTAQNSMLCVLGSCRRIN